MPRGEPPKRFAAGIQRPAARCPHRRRREASVHL